MAKKEKKVKLFGWIQCHIFGYHKWYWKLKGADGLCEIVSDIPESAICLRCGLSYSLPITPNKQ